MARVFKEKIEFEQKEAKMEKFNIKQVLYYRGQNVVDSGLEKSKCT